MSRATVNAGIKGALGGLSGIFYDVEQLQAAGSNSQANSTAITKTLSVFLTLSGVTTRGGRLPVPEKPGQYHKVYNNTTTNMKIYPNTSAKLGAGATADANVSLGPKKAKGWVSVSRTQWYLVDVLA